MMQTASQSDSLLPALLLHTVQTEYESVGAIDVASGAFRLYAWEKGQLQVHTGQYDEQITGLAQRFLFPEDQESYLMAVRLAPLRRRLNTTETPFVYHYRMHRQDDSLLYIRASFSYLNPDKKQIAMLFQDETQERLAQQREIRKLLLEKERFQFLIQNMCENFIEVDIQTEECTLTNPRLGSVAHGKFCDQIRWFADHVVVPEEREQYLRDFELSNLRKSIHTHGGFYQTYYTVCYEDGLHTLLVAASLTTESLALENRHLFLYAQDVSQLKRVEEENKKLLTLNRNDVLTGLLNRAAAEHSIQELLLSGAQGEDYLVLLDIDDFKSYNDTYGHLFGDQVLRFLGQTIRTLFAQPHIVCRWGGDEFLLLLRDVGSHPEASALLKRLADAIRNFEADGACLQLSVSMGGTAIHQGDAFPDLFERADAALYSVKRHGKDGISLF